MKYSVFRAGLANLLCLAILVGCGGGGGGGNNGSATAGSSTGGANSPTSSGSAQSIVPAAGPLGAVLAQDATALRPMVAGGIWNYQGSDQAFAGATITSFSDTLTQTAAGTGVVEADSNGFNQGSSGDATEFVQNGNVMSTSLVQLSTREAAFSLTAPELRSPVRQNDQYTLLERHIADTGVDVDGDGKTDAGDVAAYWVVAGAEDLTLDNLPKLHTVRVDSFVYVRYTLSSNGTTTQAILASKQSTWYAAGVGIVKQTLTTPNSPTDNHITTEVITSWDGGATGFGPLATTPVTIPIGNADLPGTVLPGTLSGTWAAVAQTDHALLFSIAGTFPSTKSLVSRMDMRGNVTEAHVTTVNFSQPDQSVVGDQDGAMFLVPDQSSDNGSVTASVFDTHGNLKNTSTLSLGGGRFLPQIGRLSGTPDGSVVWLMYTRTWVNVGVGFVQELVVEQVDSQGRPLAPEIVLDTITTMNFQFNAQIHAFGGKVVVSFNHPDGDGADAMVAIGSSAANALSSVTLATQVPHAMSYVTPLITSAGIALLWDTPLAQGDSLNFDAGVLLGTGNLPIRANSGSIDTETLSGISSFPMPALAGSSTIVFNRSTATPIYNEVNDSGIAVDTLSWLNAAPGMPLSTAAISQVAYPSIASIQLSLTFADRVIVLRGNSSLNATLVWLNAGTN